MAMLAERRYRKRYQLCPRGKALYEDETRFGTKMLEKMGWSKGRGLGINEDGTQDFVRLRFKNDSEGLGFAMRDDQWTSHDDDFNGLLKKLHGREENGNASDSEEEFRPMGFGFKPAVESAEETNPKKLKEKLTGISLEEKSKQSRARVHYKKFTRGKDLTQYSEKDLANIFGKKATDEIEAPVPLEKQVEIVEGEKPVNPIIGGIQTIRTGLSVNDYFKQKMEAMKKRLAENKNSENTSINATTNGIEKEDEIGEEAPIKKKKKKKDKHREEEPEIAETEVLVETVEPSKKKKKSKRAVEENVNAEQKEDPAAEASNEPKRKKKKKDKEEIVAPCELVSAEEETKKKKKSKKRKKNREEITEEPELTETVAEERKKSKTEDKEESELQEKPAKKKSKKSKREEKVEVTELQEEIKPKKKSKKNKSSNDDEMRPTSAELPVPAKEKKSKQHETEVSAAAATAAADDIECSSDATSTADESGVRYLSMEQLIKMQNSFNIFKISSFCAEKFHILDIDAFNNSSLSKIIGYSFDENIDLQIVEIKSDTQRILNLWEGKLSKYHQTDNERTRRLVNKLKYKRLTGAHIKKLQNCNAFSGL